jgi:pentatricopeptide repeat protein
MHLHSPPAPTGATYNALIRSLCRRADLARALRYLSLMVRSGWHPDAYTFNSLILGYCRAHRATAARDLFDKIPLRGFRHDVVSYAAMTEGLCDMGRIDDALELFGEMEQPDIHTHAVLVKGLCEAGRGEEGLRMLQRTKQFRWRRPDTRAYAAVVDLLCREQRVVEAEEMLGEMSDTGLLPSVVTCTAVVNAYCKKGRMRSEMHQQSLKLLAISKTVLKLWICLTSVP